MQRKYGFKHLAVSFLCGAIFFSGISLASAKNEDVVLSKIKLFWDGKDISTPDGRYDNNGDKVPAALNYEGTTYMPIRMIGSLLGKQIEWDQGCQAVIVGGKSSAVDSSCKVAKQLRAANFLYLDLDSLLSVKAKYKAGSPDAAAKVKALVDQAELEMKSGPYSVMYKTSTPPSGDKHDYISIGIYWWPNPDTPTGLPYIQKDGQVNPQSRDNSFDKNSLVKANSAIRTLTLAYYFTGKEAYAEYAASLLKTWYLNPDTKMNPNLNFGQAVPGRNDGRKEGIIEALNIMNTMDYSLLLNQTPYFTNDELKQFKTWIADFNQWLMTSKIGLEEKKATNNHGTWYDNQVAAYALFSGQTDIAKDILGNVKNRIAKQIEPDGTMPMEMSRTRSLHYPLYNLVGFYNLARLGDQLNVDLWNYETEDGRGIRKSLDFLTPYISGDKHWELDQIVDENFSEGMSTLIAASKKYKDLKYVEAARQIMGDNKDPRESLLYDELVKE